MAMAGGIRTPSLGLDNAVHNSITDVHPFLYGRDGNGTKHAESRSMREHQCAHDSLLSMRKERSLGRCIQHHILARCDKSVNATLG